MEHCKMHAAHETRMDGFDDALSDAQKNIRELAKGQHDIREKLARDEKDLEIALRLIHDQEAHTKAITKMGVSIEHLAEQVKESIMLIKEVDSRVVSLERVPNEEVKALMESIKTRVEALERAPGEELVTLAKQAKRRTVDIVTAGIVGAIITAITLIPYILNLMGGVPK